MARPEIRAALEEGDRELQERAASPVLEGRLRARLAESRRRPRRSPLLPWAGLGLAAAAVALAVWLAPRLQLSGGPRELGGLLVERASADFLASVAPDATVEVTRGDCLLEHDGVHLTLAGSTRLRREADALRVLLGSVDFQVPPRPSATYRVAVSHGTIEVLGTRFTVSQGATGGNVVLHEGAIRFVRPDGTFRVLAPGEQQAWPEPPPAGPAPVPELIPAAEPPLQEARPVPPPLRPFRPKPPPPTSPSTVLEPPAPIAPPAEKARADALLQRIAMLRTQGRYEDAARLLSDSLAQDFGEPTRERLSFELGSILTWQLGDPGRACAFWGQHVGRFGLGAYDREIDQARTHLDCGSRR